MSVERGLAGSPRARLHVRAALRTAALGLRKDLGPLALVGFAALALTFLMETWVRGTLWIAAAQVAHAFLLIGGVSLSIRVLRGERANVWRLFDGFNRFLPLVGAIFLSGWPLMLVGIVTSATFTLSIRYFPQLMRSSSFSAAVIPLSYTLGTLFLILIVVFFSPVWLAVCGVVSNDAVDPSESARAAVGMLRGSRTRVTLLFLGLALAVNITERILPVLVVIVTPLLVLVIAATYEQLHATPLALNAGGEASQAQPESPLPAP